MCGAKGNVRSGSEADCAVHEPMSALPLKADMCGTAKDVRFGPIADIALFDHFVGGQKNSVWYCDAKRLGSLEIDHELEFSGLLDWQFSRFRAL
jgi:hypothetical protein